MTARTPFGEWLRQRRHLLDLTQAELAEQSGCSPITVRKLEAGERKPSPELAQSLSAVLRIPAREHAAFIQFARSDAFGATFPLPAWEPEHAAWRSGQLPDHAPDLLIERTGLTLYYDLFLTEAPRGQQLADGRNLVDARATGRVTGPIEGTMELQITQIIVPKPADIGYEQALPMQIGAIFTVHSSSDSFTGSYTGTITPTLDEAGNGTARVQATGQVILVTAAFADLFLDYVFVEDVVRMREGTGTGASGVMQLKPAA